MKKKNIIKLLAIILLVSGVVLLYQFQNISFNKETNQDESARQEEKEIYQEISTLSVENNQNVIKNYQDKFNNTDIIAELSIENTDLLTPVAKGNDNEFYLHHLLDKSKNELGSVFLDYRNNINDRKIIIYGHNSENIYTEFHLLENYLDESYYREHSNIYLKTETDTYQYKIFSVYIATTALQHVNLNFSDEEYSNHLNWLKSNSIYDTGVSIASNDDILVLQTCYFGIDNSYLIVVAKKI